jgi:hypothetical protein
MSITFYIIINYGEDIAFRISKTKETKDKNSKSKENNLTSKEKSSKTKEKNSGRCGEYIEEIRA